MKQRKFIVVVIATLIAGQAVALDVGMSAQASPEAAAVPHEITLQHEFVESFRQFDKATPTGWHHHRIAGSFIRQVAPSLTEGMTATIIARDYDEGSLVADLYRQAGAKASFAIAHNADVKEVTIKVYPAGVGRPIPRFPLN